MKRSTILVLLLLFVTFVQSANKQNCIIIGSEQRNAKVVDTLKIALEKLGVTVNTVLISSKGISFTVDSILETSGNSHNTVGIIGVGYTGGIAAAELASKSCPAYIVLISTPAINGKQFSERLLMGSAFPLGISSKDALKIREQSGDSTKGYYFGKTSDEINQYLPEKVFALINCPVFALTGVNDARLDWYDNLSELERILPRTEDNWFKAYPQTGYVLLEEEEYVPVWIGDASSCVIANVNALAVQDICKWISGLKEE